MSELPATDTGTDPGPITRVCPKCAAQSQAPGEFCPHCGARYGRKRRSRKTAVILLSAVLALLIAGGAVAAVLIIHHNNQVAAQKRAARRGAAERQQAAAAAAAAAAAQLQAQKAAARLKRDEARVVRQQLVNALQSSVEKDADKDVSTGILNGPILKVQCQPATSLDATASIANYTCLAADSISGGELSGYRFSATINTATGSYTWHLGG